MSTTVRLSIEGWTPAADNAARRERPVFTNPVPAAVVSGGRAIGELDAHLQWDGDVLLARLPLPALPGHSVHASCSLQTHGDTEGASDEHVEDGDASDDGASGASEQWIDAISVTIEHVEDAPYGGLSADAPPIPARRARVIEEKKRRE